MVEFLRGGDLSKKIREVVRGDNLFCAVAFWGADAVRELFNTEKLDRPDVRIVCDLSMGATSPDTLKKLGAPDNKHLRHCKGLHAKVYRSDVGMVVGSANASNNGIGFMGQDAALLETGVFLKPERATWQEALRWFNQELLGKTEQVDQLALDYAKIRWLSRQRASRRENPPPQRRRPSFLQVLRDDPWLFGDVGFVLTDHAFGADERRKNIEDAIDEVHPAVELEKRVQFADFGTERTEDWPLRFIDLHMPGDRLGVHFHTRGDMAGGVLFARRSGIKKPEFKDIFIQMTQTVDYQILQSCKDLVKEILQDEDAKIWSAEQLSARLFRRKSA